MNAPLPANIPTASYMANTHEVINVSRELVDYNMATQDTALLEAVQREGAAWSLDALAEFGRLTGSASSAKPANTPLASSTRKAVSAASRDGAAQKAGAATRTVWRTRQCAHTLPSITVQLHTDISKSASATVCDTASPCAQKWANPRDAFMQISLRVTENKNGQAFGSTRQCTTHNTQQSLPGQACVGQARKAYDKTTAARQASWLRGAQDAFSSRNTIGTSTLAATASSPRRAGTKRHWRTVDSAASSRRA